MPLVLNDTYHTNGLFNPRTQQQYSFNLAFDPCAHVNDTSCECFPFDSPPVSLTLHYRAETEFTFTQVSARVRCD